MVRLRYKRATLKFWLVILALFSAEVAFCCQTLAYIQSLSLSELHAYAEAHDSQWDQDINPVFERLLSDTTLTPETRLFFFRSVLESDWPAKVSVNDHFLDALLTLNVRGVTRRVAQKLSQSKLEFRNEIIWQDTSSNQMPQTSYWNFRQKFRALPLQNGDLVVDIGAGFSRLGFYLGTHHPGVHFQGFEIVEDRVRESTAARDRLGLPQTLQFIHQDLGDPKFQLPKAKIYYAYAPVNEVTGDRIWEQLRELAQTNDFYLVGSLPGKYYSQLLANSLPWLRPVNPGLQIYRSRPG